MTYLTFKSKYGKYEPSSEDIYQAFLTGEQPKKLEETTSKNFYRTYTKIVDSTSVQATKYKTLDLSATMLKLATSPPPIEFISFKIPKRAGGTRTINAPTPELNEYHRILLNLWQNKHKILAHDCAYGYVKGRSTVDAVFQHKQNNSRWFLKVDIKDFFGSTSLLFQFS